MDWPMVHLRVRCHTPVDCSYVDSRDNTIEEAKVLVGGSRAMEQYGKDNGQKQCIVRANMPTVMDFIRRELHTQDVVVMVSGDPGYYSMLEAVRRNFEDTPIKVIPGLSSIQVAFAKLGMPWQEAELLRDCTDLREYDLRYREAKKDPKPDTE